MDKSDSNPEFEALLNHIKRNRSFDFTGYKRSSLIRRIERRMQTLNLDAYEGYIDYLQFHPDEYVHLFNTILINVTDFFRDEQAWEYISKAITPQIVTNKPSNAPLRVWSAGCASGQEAYTIAMVLAEKIGIENFREQVKIYASDADEEALSQARQASYSVKEVSNIPPALLAKYFEKSEQRYIFNKELRRSIIFGRHDLIQDAPISRVDLILCRNTLMYFNTETQSKVLARFHFALNDPGFLFLGKAEMLFTHAHLFTPVDIKRRVFTKVPRVNMRDKLLNLSSTMNIEENNSHLMRFVRFRDTAFDTNPIAQIVSDLNGFLVLANERARALLNLTPKDLNRALADLSVSYRIPELRARIEEVYIERRPIALKDVRWPTTSGDTRYMEIQIVPLLDITGTILGTSISFADVSRYHELQEEIERSNQELETAYEELQSTNEELETTNEELQSTVEELETTNEELQSTNEELETINEELQSTNEELQTINDEMRRRTEELNQLNSFLESILTSMRGGVIVLDTELKVKVWSHRSEDLWGLRDHEAMGRNFINLDIGLATEQLLQGIRGCLSKEHEYYEKVLKATNRRGKPIDCRVICTPLVTVKNQINGVILTMEEVDP